MFELPLINALVEQQRRGMLSECLPPERRDYLEQSRVAHVLMMSFDGYVISNYLNPGARCEEETIAAFAAVLMPASVRGASRRAGEESMQEA